MERLQKIISAAGVASRRKAEELITSGLVQVNGQTVTELGTKADAGKDHIRVDGKLLKFSGHHVYILLNKPKGYVTTLSDPEGRPTVVDLLRGVKQRVYPVGRLDYASEGLLLLTNDGELANALTKAASHVPKTYLVKVSGQPSDAAVEQLRAGISLPDRKGIPSRTAPAGVKLVHQAENPWYEVTLIEGRNRQVRAMFEETGHHVEKLKRVRYGPFTLDVHPGKFRNLLPEEVEQLRSAIKRGSSASAETAVHPEDRPADRTESHIETELREEARSPVKFQPAVALPGKPKRTPKPLGTFASGPRSNSTRPERPSPGGFRGNDLRKKGPYKAKFRRDSVGEKAPFQSRTSENAPRPILSPNAKQRPAWNKPGASRAGAPAVGGPRKWMRDVSSPTSRPRPYDKSAAASGRPERSSQRPEWKKPSSFRSNAPNSLGPRKWTNNAPSPRARAAVLDRPKPDGLRAGPDRPRAERSRTDRPSKPHFSKPRFKEERGAVNQSAGRSASPGAPHAHQNRAGTGKDQRAPFWQGADKRRPRKPKEEGDSERRPAARTEDPRKPGMAGATQSKFTQSKFPRPKFGPSKFSKNRPHAEEQHE